MNGKWSQASCWQTGWEFFCMDGQQKGLQHPAHGAVPHSCLHPLCPFLPFYPSSSVISRVTLPMWNWGPAPTKTSNQGKVYGPSKVFPDTTQRTEKKWKNKCNISLVPWKGPLGCWVVGRSGQEGCSALQGIPQEERWDRPICRGAR